MTEDSQSQGPGQRALYKDGFRRFLVQIGGGGNIEPPQQVLGGEGRPELESAVGSDQISGLQDFLLLRGGGVNYSLERWNRLPESWVAQCLKPLKP